VAHSYRYVRRVSLNKWQARVWLSEETGHFNLGLHDSAKDAWDAVRAYLNRGEVPDGLLPRWVRKLEGDVFAAWCKRRGRQLRVGPYLWPDWAHGAMLRLIRRTWPRGLPPRRRGRKRRRQAVVRVAPERLKPPGPTACPSGPVAYDLFAADGQSSAV